MERRGLVEGIGVTGTDSFPFGVHVYTGGAAWSDRGLLSSILNRQNVFLDMLACTMGLDYVARKLKRIVIM